MSERINPIENLMDFKTYLLSFGIPLDTWGQGEAKSVDDLWEEVQCGETILISEMGTLSRKVSFVAVAVVYEDPTGQKFVLKEDRQQFLDGRVRRRDIQSSIGEKVKPGESADMAAERALREELGITGTDSLIPKGMSTDQRMSPSYPGLITQYQRSDFEVGLNSDQYCAEGYVEVQQGKTTYFVWKKV